MKHVFRCQSIRNTRLSLELWLQFSLHIHLQNKWWLYRKHDECIHFRPLHSEKKKICIQLLYLDHFPALSCMAHASDAKSFSSLSINCVGYSSSANAIAMDSLNGVKHLPVVQLTISAETVDQFENQFLWNVWTTGILLSLPQKSMQSCSCNFIWNIMWNTFTSLFTIC